MLGKRVELGGNSKANWMWKLYRGKENVISTCCFRCGEERATLAQRETFLKSFSTVGGAWGFGLLSMRRNTFLRKARWINCLRKIIEISRKKACQKLWMSFLWKQLDEQILVLRLNRDNSTSEVTLSVSAELLMKCTTVTKGSTTFQIKTSCDGWNIFVAGSHFSAMSYHNLSELKENFWSLMNKLKKSQKLSRPETFQRT